MSKILQRQVINIFLLLCSLLIHGQSGDSVTTFSSDWIDVIATVNRSFDNNHWAALTIKNTSTNNIGLDSISMSNSFDKGEISLGLCYNYACGFEFNYFCILPNESITIIVEIGYIIEDYSSIKSIGLFVVFITDFNKLNINLEELKIPYSVTYDDKGVKTYSWENSHHLKDNFGVAKISGAPIGTKNNKLVVELY